VAKILTFTRLKDRSRGGAVVPDKQESVCLQHSGVIQSLSSFKWLIGGLCVATFAVSMAILGNLAAINARMSVIETKMELALKK